MATAQFARRHPCCCCARSSQGRKKKSTARPSECSPSALRPGRVSSGPNPPTATSPNASRTCSRRSWALSRGLPLWIPLPSTDADELVTTLQVYPDLVTVLVGAHYVHHLLVRPLLARLPNAHLELSRYEPIGEIEALR